MTVITSLTLCPLPIESILKWVTAFEVIYHNHQGKIGVLYKGRGNQGTKWCVLCREVIRE